MINASIDFFVLFQKKISFFSFVLYFSLWHLKNTDFPWLLSLSFSRRSTLREIFSELNTSAERWSAFRHHTDAMINSTNNNHKVSFSLFFSRWSWKRKWFEFEKFRKSAYLTLIDEIMFEYSYPRLDANVTKGMNHLLKSPFSIHPKTGRVSVPIDLNCLSTFDPCQTNPVPTLNELVEQVEQLPKQNQQNDDSQQEKIPSKQKGFSFISMMKILFFHLFLFQITIKHR